MESIRVREMTDTVKAMTLPDCMMPDGAEPCKAYQELYAALRQREEMLREIVQSYDAQYGVSSHAIDRARVLLDGE